MPMRWISVLFALLALLALAAPATAPAALKIGIAENDPDLFADPLFTDLAVRYARVVVVLRRHDERRRRAAARHRPPRGRARRHCRGCRIVVADILDRADDARAKTLRFGSTLRYIKRFRKALKSPRRFCGLHNYSDTNRFRDRGTKQLIKALDCSEIWLTETGGIYRFRAGRLGASPSRQLRATRYMFGLAQRYPRITPLYVYTWFGAVTPRFDAGLVARGKPRPAYYEVRRRLR